MSQPDGVRALIDFALFVVGCIFGYPTGVLRGLSIGKRIGSKHMDKATRRRINEFEARQRLGIDEFQYQLEVANMPRPFQSANAGKPQPAKEP